LRHIISHRIALHRIASFSSLLYPPHQQIETLSAVQDERYTPGESICKVAKENDVTMVVLGSRGLTKMRRTILGSVSDYVVHNSHLPVCVVRDQETICRSPSPIAHHPDVVSKEKVTRQNTAPTSSNFSNHLPLSPSPETVKEV